MLELGAFSPGFASLKVVNDDFFYERLDAVLDELQMLRMGLVFVFCFFIGEPDVQRDLIRLFDHGPVARNHFSHVKREHAGNGFQIFIGAGHHLVGGVGPGRIGPENDNV
jgi:hypothetical protein